MYYVIFFFCKDSSIFLFFGFKEEILQQNIFTELADQKTNY